MKLEQCTGNRLEANPGAHALPPDGEIKWALDSLLRDGRLTAPSYRAGLNYFSIHPAWQGWSHFIHWLGLLLGGLLFMAGVIFFIAWNWNAMPRLGKLALGEGLLVVLFGVALWRWDRVSGRSALLALAVGIGALMALYGQIYQTGADAWELFFTWSLLLVPLVAAGRQAALCCLLWLVGSCAYVLYQNQSGGFADFPTWGRMFNTALLQGTFLLAWEGAAKLGPRFNALWLRSRWLPRLVGTAFMFFLTAALIWLTLSGAWSFYGDEYFTGFSSVAGFVYVLSLAGFAVFYFLIVPDLFMLALALVSLISLVSANLIESWCDEFRLEGLLLSGLWIGFACFLLVKALLFLRGRMFRKAENEEEKADEHSKEALCSPLTRVFAWADGQDLFGPEKTSGLRAILASKLESEAPWYVRLFTFIGAMLCLSLLSIFFALNIFDSGESFAVLGGILMLGGCAGLRAPSLFMRQMGGGAVVLGLICFFGGLGAARSVELRPWMAALCFTALFAGLPSFWPRALAAFGLSASLRLSAAFFNARLEDILGGIFSLRAEELIFDLNPFTFRNILFGLAGGFCFWLLYHRRLPLERRQAEWAVPLAQGVVLDVTLVACAGLSRLFTDGLSPIAFLYQFAPFFAVATFCLLSALAVRMGRNADGEGLPPEDPPQWRACVPAAMGGLALAPCAWFAPGIAMGLLLLLLARKLGSRLGLGCAAAYFSVYISMYYYSLHLSLLHKSLFLMGSGALVLALAMFSPMLLRFVYGREEGNA